MAEPDRREVPAPAWPTRRLLRWILAAAYVLVVAAFLFWPAHVDGPGGFVRLMWLRHALAAFGHVGAFLYAALGFLANALLIAPLGAMWVSWAPRPSSAGARLASAPLVGAAIAAAAELVQLVALPGRTTDVRDILAAMIGCTVGAGLAYAARRREPAALVRPQPDTAP